LSLSFPSIFHPYPADGEKVGRGCLKQDILTMRNNMVGWGYYYLVTVMDDYFAD